MAQYKSPINGQPLPKGKPIQTSEQAREMGRKGGRKTQEKRKQLKTLKEQLEMLLAEEKPDKNGKTMTVQAGITASLVKAALEGNTKAYEIIRDTIGQKPVQTVNLNTPDIDIMEEVRKRMAQYEP